MAAPQLRLEVSLNLAGFRNEVRKLTQIAQSEFNPLLKVDVDTRDYRAQLKALERIKPVIKIEDSQLDAARARIGTLNKSLATLRRATATPIEIKLKYTEIGKPPSTAAGQIGRAVSGGVRGSQALEGANRSELLNIRKMMSEAGMALGKITSLSKATASELRNSIIPAFTNSGEEAVNGLAAGLKDSSSKIGKIAAKVGVEAVNGIKGALGIASPSRVFKQIGEFSVDGLELGFLNGLKDFKGKSVAEIRKIVALLKLELAKVSEGGGIGGPSMGSLRRQLVGQRAYTSPIGPLPVNSREPYAKGTRGQFGYSGYEPRMVSRPYTGGPRFPVEGMIAPRPEFGFASTGQPPSGGQATNRSRENTILGAMGGYNPGVRSSAMFPMNGMMGPSSPLGRITPQSSMFAGGGGGGGGAGGGGGGGGAFGGMRLNVPQLPGSGVVRELGEEFGFAAKQVLLFGTAYKALAFLQSFPGQVGEAVGALQSFRNTLKTVTPSAAEFDKSSKFILSLVDQYNVPLQSARDGFAKLYASMKPAGFSGAEIRGLFEGVSMGAATFGMSADKVDRVMYAFAQMASKGQVMSEELKGQLGDVLPGALSLFAKAADMSVQEFGQAMEDGAFKGEAMRQLLVNVGATMKEEFGKGAVGAAVTYQGVMNRLQTTTVLFYEAFEPAAVAFANTFILPITNGIRIVTDAFTQLLTGQKAVTQGGSELAANMQPLIPIFQGIGDNLKQVATAAFNTVKALLPVVQFLLQLAASPVVGFLAQMYASLLLLNGAFTLLGGRLLIGVIASLAQTAIRMTALNTATLITNSSLTGTQLQLRMLSAGFAQTGAAATGFAMTVRTAMMTTVVGAVVAAVAIAIAEFMRLRGVMASIEGKYKSLGDQARLMGEAGNVSGVQKIGQQVQEQAQTFEDLAAAMGKAKKVTAGFVMVNSELRDLLKRTGQDKYVMGDSIKPADITNINQAIQQHRRLTKELKGSILPGQESKARAETAKLDAELNKKPIDLSAGDGTGKPPKEKSLESYYSLQDQLAKAQTQADIDRIEALFEHRKNMINSAYDLEEARANSVQKEAIAHQRAISNIFMDLQKKQIDARLSMMKAEGSVASGAPAGSGGSLAGMTQYITGDPSHPSYKPDHGTIANYHDHLAFASREAAIEAYNKLTKSGIQVTEFQGFGQGVTGPHSGPGSAHHKGLAMDVPGAQWGGSGAIGAREFAGSARVRATLGMGGDVGATPGKVTPDQKRDVLADQAKVITAKQATLAITHAEIEAQQQLVVETEKYLAQIFGVAEKELQAGMLQKKTAMLRAGATDQEIEDAMSLEEINLKYAAGVEAANNQIATNNKLIAGSLGDKNILNKNTEYQRWLIGELNKELPKAVVAQTNLNEAQKDAPFLQRIRDLKEEIKLLLIVNDAERRLAELRNEYGGDAAKAQQVFNLEEIKKNIEATRALVDDFVSSTTGDYKGFLKAVISGEDAADALKQFQASLKDKVLTIFLDFAMAPIEKSLKEGLFSFFKPKVDPKLLEQEKSVNALADNTAATRANTDALAGLQGGAAGAAQALPVIPFGESADAATQSMSTIGDAFSSGLSAVNTSAQGWNQALNFGLPSVINTSAQQIGQQGGVLGNSLGSVTGVIGAAASSIMGIVAGVSQMGSGGTSGVLGGIGSIFMGLGGALGGIGGMLGGGLSSAFSGGASSAIGTGASGWSTAFATPLRFANGGMVNGPTLGLVGEGKYNEAIVPLPDGKSIPVQMRGGGGLREAMSGNNGKASGSPILNMSFQSTNINGVEYVSRDQLEAAMATTRKQAAKDGANRGMTMTLDKLQQSPQTRNRLGMG